eukprot:Nk52_evm1s434 gene=Nk52_evmTU1s434
MWAGPGNPEKINNETVAEYHEYLDWPGDSPKFSAEKLEQFKKLDALISLVYQNPVPVDIGKESGKQKSTPLFTHNIDREDLSPTYKNRGFKVDENNYKGLSGHSDEVKVKVTNALHECWARFFTYLGSVNKVYKETFSESFLDMRSSSSVKETDKGYQFFKIAEIKAENNTVFNVTRSTRPYFLQHRHGSVFKGILVMHHGFSAIPQQMHPSARLAAQQGYDVFVFLLPGEGARHYPVLDLFGDSVLVFSEDLSLIPHNSGDYESFSEYVSNDIMEAATPLYDDTKIDLATMGLSVGGAMAAHNCNVRRRKEQNLGVYNKCLITNPLIHISPIYTSGNPASTGKYLSNTFGAILKILSYMVPVQFQEAFKVSWFPTSCAKNVLTTKDGSHYPMQGFCSFTITHLDAVVSFGDAILKQSENGLGDNTIAQFVHDDRDGTVSTQTSIDLAHNYAKNYKINNSTNVKPTFNEKEVSPYVCMVDNAFGHTFYVASGGRDVSLPYFPEANCMLIAWLLQDDKFVEGPMGSYLQKDFGYVDNVKQASIRPISIVKEDKSPNRQTRYKEVGPCNWICYNTKQLEVKENKNVCRPLTWTWTVNNEVQKWVTPPTDTQSFGSSYPAFQLHSCDFTNGSNPPKIPTMYST